MKDRFARIGCLLLTAVYALAIAGLAALLSGCKTKIEYVPVESVRTEYKDRIVKELHTDTVNNTRFVYVKGDTIIDYREKERIKVVHQTDTFISIKTDTISKIVPVERKLSRWEKAKMDVGGIAMGVSFVLLCAAVWWLVKKFKK